MAQLNHPQAVFVSNGEIYIADTNNHRVRKVLRNGQIVTICGTGIAGYNGDGQLATEAQLHSPRYVVVSSSDQVYISDMHNHRIRKIDQRGMISTIAGTGVNGYNGDGQLAINAQLFSPYELFVTEDEEVLIADCSNNRVRKIDRNGMISTIAGTGKAQYNGNNRLATTASLHSPASVFQYKHEIYITEMFGYRIRKINQQGIISTIVGNGNQGYGEDGILATKAILFYPYSIFVCNDQVFISDFCRVRKILPNGIIKTVAGTGQIGRNREILTTNLSRRFTGGDMLATQCKLHLPRGIFIDSDSQVLTFADTIDHTISKIDQNGMMRRVVGTGERGFAGDVPFDFVIYPHIGPLRKKPLIKPFPHALYDLVVICETITNSSQQI